MSKKILKNIDSLNLKLPTYSKSSSKILYDIFTKISEIYTNLKYTTYKQNGNLSNYQVNKDLIVDNEHIKKL